MTPITFATVLVGMYSIHWGSVHLGFVGFDGSPRTLDLTIGLERAELAMHSAGRLLIREEAPLSEMASSLGHLPVLRQHTHFERAGLAASTVLWLSQIASIMLILSVCNQLLFSSSASSSTTVGRIPICLAVAQGICGILGPALWALLIPGVGLGRPYSLSFLWAFQAVLVTSCIHLVVSAAAAAWAYRLYKQQHHFAKLPTSSADEAPEPESAISIELDTRA